MSLSNFENVSVGGGGCHVLGGRGGRSVARSKGDSEYSRGEKGDDNQRARRVQSEEQRGKFDEDTDIVVCGHIYRHIRTHI